jgi:signal transduction histidine kinase
MRARHKSVLVAGAAVLVAFATSPLLIKAELFRTAMGDLVPMLVVLTATILALLNAIESRGMVRLFWSLIAASMGMWCFNQGCWFWVEVWTQKPIPEPFVGDIVLFLHAVPLMAAVALRPHEKMEGGGILSSMLNVLVLLVWWVAVYAFVVFPDEYVIFSPRYNLNWDLLYLLEGLVLIALSGWAYFTSSGAWRKLYGTIFVSSAVYGLASEAMNAAIARGKYRTGSAWDLPFLLALLGFLWMSLNGRWSLKELQESQARGQREGSMARMLAKLALLSLPLMGYWALFISSAPAQIRQVRFVVAMGGVAALAFVVFLKQHLLDSKMVQLLRESRRSYNNLQRLQGRVVQQEKLAALGELVALAASELEFPLSSILESSTRLAASSNLKTEQLATARKIGQQARRTRDLVSDLLSFAQQAPGEKSTLELKPLVQRAVQMEGFKLENRDIRLTVESTDPLPRVMGNANQLLQAFLQIVENAVDALEESGGGELKVVLRRDGPEVVIEFADSGPGLRNPERVFDPFYTTKPVGKGTGLGLSATYGVVRDHRGQITCYNRLEGGAVFEIRLPALRTGNSTPPIPAVVTT